MNYLVAKIVAIESVESLHRVTLELAESIVSLISLELSPKLTLGTKVSLHIKPTNVLLAKQLPSELSVANQIPCAIASIAQGKILASIKLSYGDFVFESIVTSHMLQKLDLNLGDHVYALINESDLSLREMEQ